MTVRLKISSAAYFRAVSRSQPRRRAVDGFEFAGKIESRDVVRAAVVAEERRLREAVQREGGIDERERRVERPREIPAMRRREVRLAVEREGIVRKLRPDDRHAGVGVAAMLKEKDAVPAVLETDGHVARDEFVR